MQAAERTPDVIVVGGGIVGCAAAYYLARAGSRVTLLEKDSIAYEASGRNLGAIRLQMRHPLEFPIAMEAIRIWRELDQELGVPTEYETVGNLMVTWHEKEVESFEREIERQRPLGLHVQLLRGKELQEVAPGLSDGLVAGMFSPADGQSNPQKSTIAYAVAARRQGARILTGVRADSIRVEGGRVLGVDTAQGAFSAETVLVTAGVGTTALCRPLGLDIQVEPWLHQPMVTTRVPRVTYPFVRATGPRMGVGQTADGSVIFGLAPPERLGFVSVLGWNRISRAMSEMLRFAPALRDARVVRAYSGWFEVTRDDLPIMGRVEEFQGLVVAAGFSGHGFAMGPALGKLLGELILEGRTSIPIDAFRPARFQESGCGSAEHEDKLTQLWANTAQGTDD